MKIVRSVVAISALIVLVLVALHAAGTRLSSPRKEESLRELVKSAITNPASFAKSHFTGGIGAILIVDAKIGVPVIHEVSLNSPAEAAGLKEGDRLLEVNGIATTGKSLLEVTESIRGFAAGHVTIKVHRPGSTNIELTVSRSSWKRLGVP